MTTEIRRANERDAVVISLLGRFTFIETFGYLFRKHPDDLRAYLDTTFEVTKIQKSLCKTKNTYWLGFVQGLPVGYAKLKHPSSPPGQESTDAAQLQKIYVLREFIGARIGSDLLAPLMDEAAARSAFVWLDVLQENERATGFYERHGFTAIGGDTYTIGVQSLAFTVMARPTR